VTRNYLDSSAVITNSAGAVVLNANLAAYGAPRGNNWTGTPSGRGLYQYRKHHPPGLHRPYNDRQFESHTRERTDVHPGSRLRASARMYRQTEFVSCCQACVAPIVAPHSNAAECDVERIGVQNGNARSIESGLYQSIRIVVHRQIVDIRPPPSYCECDNRRCEVAPALITLSIYALCAAERATKTAFVPPNAKEFDMTVLIFA
jgi:hypothetical protein